ncbi:sigma-70 family RNA polymerase sigma factor [Gorillibacterium timonense]|uniref:sigma-70 family RNA polymerase sigma factor n=1 Tax=Gorillibacterium timonense TaxID=1689269 RepID=UPI00071C5EC3|nr:sigma-70 family RNA polymerase sigma factor [Gorillibacterium timonense]
MATEISRKSSPHQHEIASFLEYRSAHPALFDNSLISAFFDNDENAVLLGRAMGHPTPENRKELDRAFQRFFFGVRFTKYLGSMIRYSDIDYHRRRKKYESRNRLIFDSPLGEDSEMSMGDYLLTKLPESPGCSASGSPEAFQAELDNPDLCEAFSKLTDRQKLVVTLSYSARERDTEIASRLNVSQQAVTKTRITALNKMRRGLQIAEKRDSGYEVQKRP